MSNPPTPRQDGPTDYEKCRMVLASDLHDDNAPKFSDHPAAIREIISNPKLDLKSNPIARRHRTVLRLAAHEGPNFAGHYKVAVWGCGTSCAQFAVVNLKTGRVITPNGFGSNSYVFFGDDDFLPQAESQDGDLRFRKDSKMLVVLGDLDEDETREGAFYFVIEAERLRLIHSTLVKKDCEKLRHSR